MVGGMTANQKLRWLGWLACAIAAAPAFAQPDGGGPRPNLIIIMSDDMGYSDPGCYGGEISTPNLDRLAAGGLRHTAFYNTGRCCPTRASLLTGLYAHQAGMGRMTQNEGQPGYRGDLSRNAVTIAEVMKSAGYRTYMAGKWHVTKQLKPDGDKSNWPLQRGFDEFYGTIIGAGSFFDPWTLTRGNKAVTPENDAEYRPAEYYYTDAISDHAVGYVNGHAKDAGEAPFFLYVSYTAPHWPLHALEKDIAKYEGRYDAGYDVVRRARFERMKKLGVVGDVELSPAPGDWDALSDERKRWEARCMEVYAAMVDNMDQGIGRLIGALEANGQLENTLILYLQDNGGCAEQNGRTPRRNPAQGVVPMGRDELQTAMDPARTRSGHPVLTGPAVMPGPATTYIAYGKDWANVSNTPFREYKTRNHEGGIATPLIAHWPAGIREKGGLRHEPGHLIDLMATCVDLGRATYPAEFKGRTIPPMEGRSLLPVFQGMAGPERALIWEHYGNAAIRQGKWKLVRMGGPQDPWELHDLENDRSELRDLSEGMPEKAADLRALWMREARRTMIFPGPGDDR